MSIFDHKPASWNELQNMVGQMFEEMGCEVAVGDKLKNVRGAKEIDVFVRDHTPSPPSIYLCECKHWKRAVPQETVHSFRAVMGDFGAHRGFIISTNGFQTGAFEAAKNTNINLVTFDELQDIFVERWRISMEEMQIPFSNLLFKYWDPTGGRMPKFQWTERHRERHSRLMESYEPYIHLGPTSRFALFKRKFPIVLPRINNLGQFEGQTVIETYRQLYDFMHANRDLALYHFQVLHGEVPPSLIANEYDPAN